MQCDISKAPDKVFCLFVLRFYGPVNPMGSCQAWSVYLTTLEVPHQDTFNEYACFQGEIRKILFGYNLLSGAMYKIRISYLSVQFHSQYWVGVTIVTYFGTLLKVTHFKFSGRRQADDSNKTAWEQSLNNTDIIRLWKTMMNPFTIEFLKWTLPSLNLDTSIVANRDFCHITKTCLLKYIKNFTFKNWKFSDKKLRYFSYFCEQKTEK